MKHQKSLVTECQKRIHMISHDQDLVTSNRYSDRLTGLQHQLVFRLRLFTDDLWDLNDSPVKIFVFYQLSFN